MAAPPSTGALCRDGVQLGERDRHGVAAVGLIASGRAIKGGTDAARGEECQPLDCLLVDINDVGARRLLLIEGSEVDGVAEFKRDAAHQETFRLELQALLPRAEADS